MGWLLNKHRPTAGRRSVAGLLVASGKPSTPRYTDVEKAQAVRLVRQLRRDLSWAWSGSTLPTEGQGLAGLEGLWQQLPRGERRLIDQAFEQARTFIRHCAPAGCPPPGKNRMMTRGVSPGDARVDIEIITGIVFR